MLGRLARALRLLGHDAEYARDLSDDAILDRATAEGRTIVTRDVELARRASGRPGSWLLRTRILAEQLREAEALAGPEFRQATPLSRCALCNIPLDPVLPNDPGIPPHAAAAFPAGPFWRCPRCRRNYWPGTHVADIRLRLGIEGLHESHNP